MIWHDIDTYSDRGQDAVVEDALATDGPTELHPCPACDDRRMIGGRALNGDPQTAWSEDCPACSAPDTQALLWAEHMADRAREAQREGRSF